MLRAIVTNRGLAAPAHLIGDRLVYASASSVGSLLVGIGALMLLVDARTPADQAFHLISHAGSGTLRV